MPRKEHKMLKIDEQILNIDKVICRHIDASDFSGRGAVSQDILAQLRNFIEHIMLKFYAKGEDIDDSYKNICKAVENSKKRGELKVLNRFYDYLEIVASHYTLDEENSERLMLKYYTYLYKIRMLLDSFFGMKVLDNLEKFPLHKDPKLEEYYEKIAEKVDTFERERVEKSDKYYVQKIKPVFVNRKVYYEVTLSPATDNTSKFNRMIAFTSIDITDYYAAKFMIRESSISLLGNIMPIFVITGWEISIRDCEYQNFVSIICGTRKKVNYAEQQGISRFLTSTRSNLVDLLNYSEEEYNNVKYEVTKTAKSVVFFEVLDKCRKLVKNSKPGVNVIKYMLFHMNNKFIKNQRMYVENSNLSGLYLQNGCMPFDNMPFINSPLNHNPKLRDLFECISIKERKHEILARFIKNNTEIKGQMFTAISEVENMGDIGELIDEYNDKLWYGHRPESDLAIENGQIFINSYKLDTCNIISKLKDLSKEGEADYSNAVLTWIEETKYNIDSDEKKDAMVKMFSDSHVALIYGAAGTGKTHMIKHLSNYFSDKSQLFLAQTNPAVDNLKRRIDNSKYRFSTIAKFLNQRNVVTRYDVLVIDECSTVSNKDMRAILRKASFKYLILVGDIYQIASIRFGNWFNVAKYFMPNSAVFELKSPYRTEDEGLLTFWDRVRTSDDRIKEIIAKKGYSKTLDESIFTAAEDDEIILCLNYDGLYGINNINRFLQQSNPNKSIFWGMLEFKTGDPILFNESERFAPIIYNNMKGKIIGIEILDEGQVTERIQFDVLVYTLINEDDARWQDFDLLSNNGVDESQIRFVVNKLKNVDDDEENSLRTELPFQIAYAVSIHKAQGLEYRSVKIVITDEVDELITHNIFYTAITRAREKLKIYWTPEVEQAVLERIKPKDIKKDVGILRKYINSQTQ
jgi:Cdc6-like AAA superfamily ATPase